MCHSLCTWIISRCHRWGSLGAMSLSEGLGSSHSVSKAGRLLLGQEQSSKAGDSYELVSANTAPLVKDLMGHQQQQL